MEQLISSIFLIAIGTIFIYASFRILIMGFAFMARFYIIYISDPEPISKYTDKDRRVEIEGSAHKDAEILHAPISGDECLGWKIELLKNTDRNSEPEQNRSWDLKSFGQDTVPFVLSDESNDSLFIDVQDAEVEIDNIDLEINSSEVEDFQYDSLRSISNDNVRRIHQNDMEPTSKDLIPDDDGFNWKYRERRIELGDELHIFGGQYIGRSEMRCDLLKKGSSRFFQVTKGNERDDLKKDIAIAILISTFGLICLFFGVAGVYTGLTSLSF